MSSADDIRRTARDPHSACEGKVAFESYDLAAKVGHRKTSQARGRSAYRCGACGKWHVGSDITRMEAHKHRELKERKQHGK